MQNSGLKKEVSVGVCKETKSIWERRVPISPEGCKKLIKSGINVIVQPSQQRCFTDYEYLEAGCSVQEDLSECKVILSINEVDEKDLIDGKTYMFFSNCIKGQFMRMPLLRKINDLKIRLIDYQCIREVVIDESNNKTSVKRLIQFDNLVGYAGTINILKAVGDLLLSQEISTPFIFTKLSYMYPTLKMASDSLKTMGEYIVSQELPSNISPFIVGVIGNDLISNGVQDALKLLPNLRLSPKDLIEGNYEKRSDLIYYVVFDYEDIYSHQKGSEFSLDDFKENPELYQSNFYSKYFSKISIIINCMYLERRFPKILTKSNLKEFTEVNQTFNLLGISDVTGSLHGIIDLLEEFTSNKKPYFIYDVVAKKIIPSFEENNLSIVYHTPSANSASFALDASSQFSESLIRFIENLAFSNYPEKDDKELVEELKIATITSNGSLTQKYINLFQSSLENEKIQNTRHNRSTTNHKYYVSVKLKGHLVVKGLLKKLVYSLNKYNIDFDIIYLEIGKNIDDESILYIDIFAETSELIMIFLIELKGQSNHSFCEFSVTKNNLTQDNSTDEEIKELFRKNSNNVKIIY